MKHILYTIIALVIFAVSGGPVFAAQPDISDPSAGQVSDLVAADERPALLASYLTSKNSPLTAESAVFVREADRLGLNWKLVAAIAGVESTFGKRIPANSYNAWGWGVFTGTNDGVHFTSWEDGITTVSEGLKTRYVDRGADTVDKIGRIYAASPAWSAKVKWMIGDIEDFIQESRTSLEVTI